MKARAFSGKTGPAVAAQIEAWSTENEVVVRQLAYAIRPGWAEALVLYVDGREPEPAEIDGLFAAWKRDVLSTEPKAGGAS